MEKTFLQACIEGTAKPGDVDKWIDAWHSKEGEFVPLHEFLGFSKEQYEAFAKGDLHAAQIVIIEQTKYVKQSGRTTRIIDKLVQEFFQIDICTVKDHFAPNDVLTNKRHLRDIANTICQRLYNEHRLEYGKDIEIKETIVGVAVVRLKDR